MRKPDYLIKFECNDCEGQFIVSEYILQKHGMSTEESCPCPYCGSHNTEGIVGTDEETIEEIYDYMGCMGISHKEE